MWSELFFQNLRESSQHFFFGRTKYSLNDIEYALFEELKSEEYEPFLKSFIDKGIEYPDISVETCPSRRKHLTIRNFTVKYIPHESKIQVCKNYMISKQNLKEEFRRENTLVYDHLVGQKPITKDLNSLAVSIIRGCRAEMEAGLDYSTGGRKTHSVPKVKHAAIQKYANIHLKVGKNHILNLSNSTELPTSS
jgi:hypothetical protein